MFKFPYRWFVINFIEDSRLAMAILPASDASGSSSSFFSGCIEVPVFVEKVRQKEWSGDAFFGVEWNFRGSNVAEDVGGSNAPTVAQLRLCASATHRQPRDGIRAQSSRSSPPHAPRTNTKRARTPHTASQGSELSVRLGGKGRKEAQQVLCPGL
ncbi:hypothetical protein CSIM01_09782 [Colletotrichum simmondsii]|uniref:Uncharacterized protein n=1 Tax=Colletotrichum simmondsii TaxID=703756 RepID=A0A135RX75_9PEZI|nr:hypothetical protein CSIM01_09782 [Colletotrichum simmondsii]